VNGDGYTDLLIGSPHYFSAAGPEIGKVYIYYGSSSFITRSTIADFNLTGPVGSRFGTSVTVVGDIDKDGIADFYVGSPGANAAYGFKGGNPPVRSPSWDHTGPTGFGHLVVNVGDVNGDSYPDVIITVESVVNTSQLDPRDPFAVAVSKNGTIIYATIRDHNFTYPDFERYNGNYISNNIPWAQLDSDLKMVSSGCCIDPTNNCYNTNPLTALTPYCNGTNNVNCNTPHVQNGTISTPYGNVTCNCKGSEGCQVTGPQYYHIWYRDTATINLKRQVPITLLSTGNPFEFYYNSNQPTNFLYVKDGFFPVSQDLWQEGVYGNKNFAFSTEIYLRFTYFANQTFQFAGDDDVYIFINNIFALDIGGLHPEVDCTITGPYCSPLYLDAKAAYLNITVGNTYNFHVFHAERHTTSSNFIMTTTIQFTNGGG